MKIVIAGGTGFIGQPLVERLLSRGEVIVLSRHPSKVARGRGMAWSPPQQGAWSDEVAAADVVINLAGENIGDGRWTEARKNALVRSRIDSTTALATAVNRSADPAKLFLSASAVGYYGPRGDETLDENATRGVGFLADLVEKWESAARSVEGNRRLVITRFGVVLDNGGGALAKMLLPFRLGLGGPIGSGKQWMSWIDREDVHRAIEWAIDHRDARGVYNVTSPQPVRNRDFTRALAAALHRPAFIPIPSFALRIAFGEMADETLLTGQKVVPNRLASESFAFGSPTIESALGRIFGA